MGVTLDCIDADTREAAVEAGVRAVRAGQLVVLPTDTLYGIGADAFDSAAISSLLAAKGRGRDMPVPVLVGSWDTVDGLVGHVDQRLRDLVEAFWPGGLTIVVEHARSLSWDLGDSRGTVALRMPLHPVALDLLRAVGPMGVSSANRSGQAPAQTAGEARDQLGDLVSVYLDAGPVARAGSGGVASTIVDVTTELPKVLRLGAVTLDDLRRVLPDITA